jgi:DNA-binding NarL/FixJ family response regulator
MKHFVVVEDITETRHWLVRALQQAFPDYSVREARDMREGIQAARGLPVDLALVDLGLPDGSGVEVVRAFRTHQPEAIAIVATVMGDDASIIAALSAGAQGYLLKDSPMDHFVAQLKQLQQGIPALSPSVARRIMEHFRNTAFAPESDNDLTPREREVLSHVGRGLRNADVALALGLTVHTVAGYIKSIYAKLDISTRAEAALKATRMGLTGS